MRKTFKQKIYCYADETGQDFGTDFFIVTVVISDQKQEPLRDILRKIETSTKIGVLKWQKTSFKINKTYLKEATRQKVGKIYFNHYKKPVPYFFPVINQCFARSWY